MSVSEPEAEPARPSADPEAAAGSARGGGGPPPRRRVTPGPGSVSFSLQPAYMYKLFVRYLYLFINKAFWLN